MPDLLTHVSQYKRNTLPARQSTSARRMLYRRAGYEGDALGAIAKARARVKKGIETEPDLSVVCMLIRELDRLLERERIVLRIPLPGSAKSSEPRTIHRLDRDTTATVIESSPVQPSPELQAKLEQHSTEPGSHA